jgi:hypothetical protein
MKMLKFVLGIPTVLVGIPFLAVTSIAVLCFLSVRTKTNKEWPEVQPHPSGPA